MKKLLILLFVPLTLSQISCKKSDVTPTVVYPDCDDEFNETSYSSITIGETSEDVTVYTLDPVLEIDDYQNNDKTLDVTQLCGKEVLFNLSKNHSPAWGSSFKNKLVSQSADLTFAFETVEELHYHKTTLETSENHWYYAGFGDVTAHVTTIKESTDYLEDFDSTTTKNINYVQSFSTGDELNASSAFSEESIFGENFHLAGDAHMQTTASEGDSIFWGTYSPSLIDHYNFPFDELTYIGFKLTLDDKTKLGWIKLKVIESQITVYEYAINK